MSLKQLGRYEITGTLGRGAMGVVYKAHDPLIERVVAIKTISYAGLTPEEAKDFEQRFFLEAKSAGRLNHPNIVTIHDVGRMDDLAYIAMEFLSGQSLRTVIDSGVVLSTRRIVEIAIRVADGLAFAHKNWVVHRDIKPANIMVLDTKAIKIADFGIALLPSGSLTLDGSAVGSPKYMSPEQVLGKKADGRSDIFSLGTVLYEMLTGHPPFIGADLNAILYQVLNGAPPLPSSINPSLPASFDRIIARALAKDPNKRYQTAAEMSADLRNYRRIPGLLNSNDKTIKTKKPEKAEKTTSDAPKKNSDKPVLTTKEKTSKPTRKLSNIMAISLLALLAGIGSYMWQQRAKIQITAQAAPVTASVETPQEVKKPQQEAEIPIKTVEELPQEQPSLPEASPPKSEPTSADLPKAAKTVEPSPQIVDSPKKASFPDKAALMKMWEARKKAKEEKRAKKEAAEKPAPQAKEPEPTAPPPPPVNDWKTSLHAELAACDNESFISKLMCKESARWKYCPGRWGSTAECTKGSNHKP